MTGRQVHRTGTLVLSALMVAIGVALIVQVIAGSASGSVRLLLGLLFVAGGAARIYVEVRRGRRA